MTRHGWNGLENAFSGHPAEPFMSGRRSASRFPFAAALGQVNCGLSHEDNEKKIVLS